jgi:hypothetical protein
VRGLFPAGELGADLQLVKYLWHMLVLLGRPISDRRPISDGQSA